MARVLSITDWEKHFENNRTRDLKRMEWVPLPTKQDGDGYTELLDHKDGAAHFGAWCAILQIAAKCQPRGTLMRDRSIPHDAASLSRLSRIKVRDLEDAIERLICIGWLSSQVLVPNGTCGDPAGGCGMTAGKPQEGAVSRARAGTEGNGTERENTEGNGTERHTSAPPQWTAACVSQVAEYYRAKYPRRRVDDSDRKMIAARLKDGFTVEELCQAVDGCSVDPWHQGANDRNKKYDQPRHVFKSAAKVNDFIEVAREGPPAAKTERTAKTEQARQQFLQRMVAGVGE
jgi:uncharacterized phage protein (TIGR02220 family)